MTLGDHRAIEVAGLEKRYGDRPRRRRRRSRSRRARCSACSGRTAPARRRRSRSSRATATPDAGRGAGPRSRPRRATAPALRPRIGVMLQEGGLYPGLRPLEAARACSPRTTTIPTTPSGSSTWSASRRRGHARAPALRRPAPAPVARARARRPARGACSSTSRPRAWTRTRARRRGSSCASCATAASPSCSRRTRMDEAEHLCDRVAIVDRGRIVAAGTPAELTERGRRRDLRFSSAARARPAARSRRALGLPAGAVRRGPAGRVRDRAHRDARRSSPTSRCGCATRATGSTSCARGRRSLEEVFLATHRGRTDAVTTAPRSPRRRGSSCSDRCGAARACSSRS